MNADAPGSINGGRIALTLASGEGHKDVVEILLTAGPNVSSPRHRYTGRTPLQATAEGGYMEVVKRLLNVGAHINAEPVHNLGRTALRGAASNILPDFAKNDYPVVFSDTSTSFGWATKTVSIPHQAGHGLREMGKACIPGLSQRPALMVIDVSLSAE